MEDEGKEKSSPAYCLLLALKTSTLNPLSSVAPEDASQPCKSETDCISF